MKRDTLLLLAAAGIIAYFLFKPKKKEEAKPAESKDDKKGPAKDKIGGPYALPLPPQNGQLIRHSLNLGDLVKKPVYYPRENRIRPELKEPVIIQPVNLIPNVYDRGVGAKLSFDSDKYYASFSGPCSENIQTACRCVKEKDTRYKQDIPQLP